MIKWPQVDREQIVQEYHRAYSEMRKIDVVTPWFPEESCYHDGHLLPRCAVGLIALIGLISSVGDIVMVEAKTETAVDKDMIKSARTVLVMLFLVVNVALLCAVFFKIAVLVQVYIWYTPNFVILGLVVALVDFVLKAARTMDYRSCFLFFVEVAFMFTIFRCLPLVNRYLQIIKTQDSLDSTNRVPS